MSKGKKIALGIVGTLLVLLIGVIAFYYFYFNSAKNIFKTAVNSSYNKFSDVLNKDSIIELDENKFAINGNLKFSSSENMEIGKYNYDFSLGMDKSSKQLYGTIAASNNNNKVISGNILLNNTNLYATIPELYSKTLTSSVLNDFWNSFEEASKTTLNDYNYVLKLIKNEFLNTLKDSDFTKSTETTSINGKDMKLTRVSFKMNKERKQEILNTVVKSVTNDTKAKKIMANLLNVEEAKIEEELSSEVSNETLEIVLYTKSFSSKTIKAKLLIANKEVASIDSYKDITNIIIADDGSTIKVNLTKNNDKDVIKVSYNNEEYATITINEYNNKKLNADYVIKLSDTEVATGNVAVTTTKDAKNKATYTVKSNATVESNGKKSTAEVDCTISVSDELKVPQIDTINTIDMNNLTDGETNEITSKLLTNQFVLDLMKDIS